jgi:tripartite-type tricarboxylate transporter receptor subunit TctC
MKRRTLLKSMAALAAAFSFSAAHAAWPERPVTLIVPWAAGGGTDATARIIGALLEKELGQPVNVVNRAGGNGVVGHQAIAGATPDGYTLGMITVEISMMHHQGLTQLSPKNYTPLALMNVDPAAVTVSAASQYKTMDDLMKAIRANPGKLKASGTGQGGIWHLALAGMLKDLKLEPSAVPFVPSNIQKKMETVLKKINDSKEFKDFMAKRGFGVAYADGAGFAKFMEKGDADMGRTLQALGMAKQ